MHALILHYIQIYNMYGFLYNKLFIYIAILTVSTISCGIVGFWGNYYSKQTINVKYDDWTCVMLQMTCSFSKLLNNALDKVFTKIQSWCLFIK